MATITKKFGAGLVGALLAGAALVSAGPALAKGGHGGGHGGGRGHHHHGGWGRSLGYGSGGYAPVYYGGCYYKQFATYRGLVYKKVCY